MNMALHHLWETRVTISAGDNFKQDFIVAVGDKAYGYKPTMKAFDKGKKNPYVGMLVELVQKAYPDDKVKVFFWHNNSEIVIEMAKRV